MNSVPERQENKVKVFAKEQKAAGVSGLDLFEAVATYQVQLKDDERWVRGEERRGHCPPADLTPNPYSHMQQIAAKTDVRNAGTTAFQDVFANISSLRPSPCLLKC